MYMQIIKWAYYFVKEMVLGKISLTVAWKEHKLKVFFMALVMISFSLNVFFVPKTVQIAYAKVKGDRTINELKVQIGVERERSTKLEATIRNYEEAYSKIVSEKQKLLLNSSGCVPTPQQSSPTITDSTKSYILDSVDARVKRK